jgi:hypothetical protein
MKSAGNNIKIYRKIIIVILLLIVISFLIISVWCISFGFLAGYISAVIIIIGCFFALKYSLVRLLFLTLIIWFICNITLFQNTIGSYNIKKTLYYEKILKGKELNFFEKANIFGLNIIISLIAFPIYPEISIESFFLIFPAKNETRYFYSDFFMKSKIISKMLTDNPDKSILYISWKTSDYSFGNFEARYALALNPCCLKIIKANGIIKYTANVRAEYPMHSEVIILKNPIEIKCEEGLFWYLQKAEWLHPYNAIWINKY